MLPLEGVRVLDLSMLLPGPLCAQVLRDFGATVTKIEPPYPGDYMALWPPMAGPVSATYLAVNHGKQIMSLNLKDAGERERFYELARGADVVVEGFRPGVIDKLGIGYARLAELNPGIIVCSISGYGQSGPYAQRGGHDLNYQALAGVLSIAGDQALRPPNPRLQTADTAAGSYAAAMLILAALLERQKTGRGRHLDVSMSEQLLPLATTLHAAAQAEQRDPASDGELLSGGAPCYRIYRTKDGGQISVGALEPKFWQAVLAVLGLTELANDNHLLGPDAERIAARLAEVFATRTRDEWAAAFAAVDACVEPVLTFSETRRHPQWQARESFERLPTPDGREILAPKMPGSLAGFGR
jgi:crotonobetainyl-CoA:carnitine CoA-transferase CaiB-like acyl-CoA transferase